MWAWPTVRRRKASETKILVHNVFWAKQEEEEFHTVWTLKGNEQFFFSNILERIFRNLTTLKSCFPQTITTRTYSGDAAQQQHKD